MRRQLGLTCCEGKANKVPASDSNLEKSAPSSKADTRSEFLSTGEYLKPFKERYDDVMTEYEITQGNTPSPTKNNTVVDQTQKEVLLGQDVANIPTDSPTPMNEVDKTETSKVLNKEMNEASVKRKSAATNGEVGLDLIELKEAAVNEKSDVTEFKEAPGKRGRNGTGQETSKVLNKEMNEASVKRKSAATNGEVGLDLIELKEAAVNEKSDVTEFKEAPGKRGRNGTGQETSKVLNKEMNDASVKRKSAATNGEVGLDIIELKEAAVNEKSDVTEFKEAPGKRGRNGTGQGSEK